MINLSGGVDSTYYLWKLLQRKGVKVLVHHCDLFKQRVEEERRAVDRVLSFFSPDRYELRRTVFSRKGITGKLQDIEVVFFMAGLLAKDTDAFPNLHRVVMSRCKEELEQNRLLHSHVKSGRPLAEFKAPGNRIATAVQTLLSVSRRPLRVESPYQTTPKATMIAELPLELVKAVWYCRKPSRPGVPCETCHACRRAHSMVQERIERGT